MVKEGLMLNEMRRGMVIARDSEEDANCFIPPTASETRATAGTSGKGGSLPPGVLLLLLCPPATEER